MMFYETSAVEGLCVDEAFFEMAKAALKRDAEQAITMPATISDAGGALKLQQNKHGKNAKNQGQTTVKSNCC